MSVREEFDAAVKEESAARREYEELKAKRELLANEFFGMKYEVRPEDILVTTDRGQEIKFDFFVQWSGNLDDRPDVFGFAKLPFGWAKKSKRYKGFEWMTKREAAERGNE